MENNILVRCSKLGALLTNPISKKDKEEGNLSETTKTLAHDIFLRNEFGYKENVYTDEMLKGLYCEQDSMELVQSVLGGEFRKRSGNQLKNKFIQGTPDIVLDSEDVVEDIKTSWDLRTFFNAELSKPYLAQGQGYMWLTGKKKYRLIYCLVPTPQEFILNEKKKLYYKFECNEENIDYKNACDQIDFNNNLILEIPNEKRIKKYEFDFDETIIEEYKRKIIKLREYYSTLSINKLWE
jgi:hypothetical protein